MLLHLESIKTSKARDARDSSFTLNLLSISSVAMERDACYITARGFAAVIFFLPLSHNNTAVAPLTHKITKPLKWEESGMLFETVEHRGHCYQKEKKTQDRVASPLASLGLQL